MHRPALEIVQLARGLGLERDHGGKQVGHGITSRLAKAVSMCIIHSASGAYVVARASCAGRPNDNGNIFNSAQNAWIDARGSSPNCCACSTRCRARSKRSSSNLARFLHQQTSAAGPAASLANPAIELRVASATTLLGLTGLVALGGDAVADTESLYDGADNGLH